MAIYVADFLAGVPDEIDFVRDTSAREFDENGVLRTFGVNQPAGPAYGPDGAPLGLAVWASYTNSFRNSDAPATQTVALKAGYYTLSVRGTGSISISGVGTAFEGTPLIYTIAEDQNVTFQVTGDVLYGANDSQLYPGSPIGTGDSAVRRGADFPTINLLEHPLVDLSAFTVMLEFMPGSCR